MLAPLSLSTLFDSYIARHLNPQQIWNNNESGKRTEASKYHRRKPKSCIRKKTVLNFEKKIRNMRVFLKTGLMRFLLVSRLLYMKLGDEIKAVFASV